MALRAILIVAHIICLYYVLIYAEAIQRHLRSPAGLESYNEALTCKQRNFAPREACQAGWFRLVTTPAGIGVYGSHPSSILIKMFIRFSLRFTLIHEAI
jgi:hypothetical protein